MNRINPDKLKHSKWTATHILNKEKHFLVVKVIPDDNDRVIGCELQAILTRTVYHIDWQELKDSSRWLMGWK